ECVSAAPTAATGRNARRHRDCDDCPTTPKHGDIVVRPASTGGGIRGNGEGGGDCYGRCSRPLRGAGRPQWGTEGRPIGEHGRRLARALSVLSLLLAAAAFGSRGRGLFCKKCAKSAHDLPNQLGGTNV